MTAQPGDACAPEMTAKSQRVHPNVTLAVLSLGALAYAVLSAAVIPALPTIQHDLHTTETGVTWVLTAYLLAASVGTSIIGRLGDMYGKERVLVWTLAILALGTLLAAVSDSLGVVIVGRALQGAAGGIFPLAFGIVRDEFPREKVAGSIGLLSAILGVGGGLGIVGSGVVDRAPQLALAVLDPADRDRRRRDLHVAVHARVASARAGQSQLARRRPDDDRHLRLAAGGQPDDHLGLGLGEDDRPARRRTRRLAPSGSRSRCAATSRSST